MTFFDVFLLRSKPAALEATFLEVFSLRAIRMNPCITMLCFNGLKNADGRGRTDTGYLVRGSRPTGFQGRRVYRFRHIRVEVLRVGEQHGRFQAFPMLLPAWFLAVVR